MNAKTSAIGKKLKLGAAALGTALLLAGCGPASSENTSHNSGTVNPPNSINNLPPGSAQAVMSVLGAYSGTLSRLYYTWDGEEPTLTPPQNYSVNLSLASYPNRPAQEQYAYLGFSTSGPAGTASYSAFLNTLVNGYSSGNSVYYKFQTLPEKIPGFTNSAVSVEMTIVILNGNQVDPAQSKIRFLACEFSQGITCSREVSDVRFGNDLRKH